jgi:hypothetical protein
MAIAIEDRPAVSDRASVLRRMGFMAEAVRQRPHASPAELEELARALMTAHLHRIARAPRSSRAVALERARARRAAGNGHPTDYDTAHQKTSKPSGISRPTVSEGAANGTSIRASTRF